MSRNHTAEEKSRNIRPIETTTERGIRDVNSIDIFVSRGKSSDCPGIDRRRTAFETPRYRGHLLSASVSVVIFATSGSALAAPPASEGGDQPATQLSEVVVTAQRRSENIQDVPVSVQAITGSSLERKGIKVSSDIGLITPNVTITLPNGEGNQPSITIRGVGLNDFNSNNAGPNGIYVDDVYVSAPAMQTFALFDINQVEVLKGPQGTLYGRNTSGGAVVINSIRPSDVLTGDFRAEYSSFNSYQITGAVGGPLIDTLEARVALVLNHSDGFMTNLLNGNSVSGTDNQAGRMQLLYTPTDHLKVLFSSTFGSVSTPVFQYRHIGTFVPGTQSGASPTLCSVPQAYANQCVDIFGEGTPFDFYGGNYTSNEKLNVHNNLEILRADYSDGPWTVTSITSYQGNRKYHPEDTAAGPRDTVHAIFGVKSDTVTQELRGAYNGSNAHLVVGAYYLHETLKQNQPVTIFYDGDLYGGLGIPAGPGAFDGVAQLSHDFSKQVTDSAAVFGQGDYTIGALTLTLGGRYTHEKKSFNYLGYSQFQQSGRGNFGSIQDFIEADESLTSSDFTWRAAATYHFTRDVMAYASAATGFKAGGFNGGFLSNNAEQAALQLKPIRPEQVTAYEIGFKSSLFDHSLIANGALFYNQYDDQQVYALVPQIIDSGVGPLEQVTSVLTNAKKAHTEGVELSFTALPLPGLSITAQPAWLKTRLDDVGVATLSGSLPLSGKQLANSPRFSFFGEAGYEFKVWGGRSADVEVSASYKGSQYFDSTNDPYTAQAGYWVANASANYSPTDQWTMTAFVKNLTGQKYFTDAVDLSAPLGFIQGYLGEPRVWGAAVKYKF
jgi:iron complex outermembrane recepter protein